MNKKINIIFLSFLLFSCHIQHKEALMEKVFKIKIGYGENEIGIFFKDKIIQEDSLNVFYKNGFYYISDLGNNKIIKVTEKGMPVLTIYNPEDNPHLKPTITNNNSKKYQEKLVFVKLNHEFPISSPGVITCDINKNIYVVNKHSLYKKTNEDGSIADSMILKFNTKGKILFKLGKEGIDSIPFGYIINMITDIKNNLVIQENSTDGIIIYKFSSAGLLLTKAKITIDDIPISQKEADYIVDIIDIKLTSIEDEIYITCQYVKESIENFSIITYKTMYEKILKYSLKSKKIVKLALKINPAYLDISKIPKNPTITELYGNKKTIMKPLKNLIGIDNNRNMYLTQPELPIDLLNENKKMLFIYDKKAKLKKNMLIKYPLNIQYSSEIFFCPCGKMFFCYIENGEIQFVVLN
ncbi:MAG: hypothetical protein KAT05_13645 [Spirochaetes bacterium]|nr:hypothetical protein [Spirochaetota bacterium]